MEEKDFEKVTPPEEEADAVEAVTVAVQNIA